jgi:hypothetical protein
MMDRVVTWMRQERGLSLPRTSFSPFDKPTYGISDLGFEKVCGLPAYDNGNYIVIDTVKDIKWAVMAVRTGGAMIKMRDDFINKYEAIEYADDLLAADERYDNEGMGS